MEPFIEAVRMAGRVSTRERGYLRLEWVFKAGAQKLDPISTANLNTWTGSSASSLCIMNSLFRKQRTMSFPCLINIIPVQFSTVHKTYYVCAVAEDKFCSYPHWKGLTGVTQLSESLSCSKFLAWVFNWPGFDCRACFINHSVLKCVLCFLPFKGLYAMHTCYFILPNNHMGLFEMNMFFII